jgi:hypothetical protein
LKQVAIFESKSVYIFKQERLEKLERKDCEGGTSGKSRLNRMWAPTVFHISGAGESRKAVIFFQ